MELCVPSKQDRAIIHRIVGRGNAKTFYDPERATATRIRLLECDGCDKMIPSDDPWILECKKCKIETMWDPEYIEASHFAKREDFNPASSFNCIAVIYDGTRNCMRLTKTIDFQWNENCHPFDHCGWHGCLLRNRM